jgi:hypothetical protein
VTLVIKQYGDNSMILPMLNVARICDPVREAAAFAVAAATSLSIENSFAIKVSRQIFNCSFTGTSRSL